MKIIRIIFTHALILVSLLSYSQTNISISNQKTIGGNNIESLLDIKQLSNGEFITAGWSESGISGDKTDASYGYADGWVVKFSSTLQVQWQKSYGGDSIDILNRIIETEDGGFLLGGFSSSSVSGNKTAPNIGGFDIWIIKIDSLGGIQWQKTYGGLLNEGSYYAAKGVMEIIPYKNGYLLGCISASDISSTKSEDSRGGIDYWIINISNTGNIVWDKTIGGGLTDHLNSMSIFSTGEILLCGESKSDVSGDKSSSSQGYEDNWLVLLDSNRNIIWDKTIGGSFSEYLGYSTIHQDIIYVGCYSDSDISGDKTESSKGGADYWVIKLDKNGTILWNKTIGGNGWEVLHSLTYTKNNQILLCGNTLSGISGDKSENNNGEHDYWIVSIDTNSNIVWQKNIGGSTYDKADRIIEAGENSYVIAGTSNSNISYDKTESNRGDYDYWIVELATNVSISNSSKSNSIIDVFPNPFENYLQVKTDSKISYSLFDMNGRLLKNGSTTSSCNLNTETIRSGVYILNIHQNGNLVKSVELIKNK
jgi:hypothetical protein